MSDVFCALLLKGVLFQNLQLELNLIHIKELDLYSNRSVNVSIVLLANGHCFSAFFSFHLYHLTVQLPSCTLQNIYVKAANFLSFLCRVVLYLFKQNTT